MINFTENHWSNTKNSVEFFKEIIFPYLEDTKQSKCYPIERHGLITMDTFKGQDNVRLKKLCAENNLTNKLQQLNLSVNKATKSFIQNKYNDWFAEQVFMQLQNGKDPTDVKLLSKLSDLKPIHENPFKEQFFILVNC